MSAPGPGDDRYRRLFLSVREAIVVGDVVRDRRGEIVDWLVRDANGEVVVQVAMTRDQMIGRRLSEILDGAAAEAYLAASREVMRTGNAQRFEVLLPTPNRWYLTNVFRLDDATIVSAGIDITDRKRAEQQLRDADRRKDEFLGMLSHELRNPLAPIRNAIQVLHVADPAAPEAARARAIIERQAAHLTQLVDELLDVTRIARGRIELRREPLDLGQTVRRAVDDHRSVLSQRHLALAMELPATPVWVDGDATRLTQVVGNLLANAAKFGRPGGAVSVRLCAARGEAVLRVADTGAGIDPALLPRVFEPFVQGERTLARTEGGLGLGLALVRGIAELHGGSVSADSAGPERGAEFVVRIPLAEPPAARLPGVPAPPPARRARRVLVIDDNVDAAESMADLLRLLGHDAEVAFEGPSALASARASPPEVVLCDIGLPGMTGYEVARALRADPALAGIALYAVTGYAQEEDRRRALEAGFDGHVAKPPDPAEIERLLA